MQFKPVSDQDRSHQVVDGADHEYAPDTEDHRIPPIAFHRKVECGRHPHHKGTQYRHHRQQCHHKSPQQRRRQIQPPEHQSTEESLHARNRQRAVDGGVNGVAHADK